MRVEIKNNTMFINTLTGLFPQSLLSEVNGFTIDSRLIQNGDVYLPIKGENIDGHDFIPQAIANGASLIFSEQFSTEALTEVIYVESTVDTLKELSIGYMSQIQCPIISITGSNGKTTTKELLSHILGSYKKIMCTAGNYNSTIGLPISIFAIAGDEDFCVLEMGASEPNEIAELCRIAQPTMGLITNISASHTENFGSLENVAKAKSDLFTCLPNDGTAFVNIDDNYISKFSTHANRVTYGFKSDADFIGDFNDGVLKINNNVILLPYTSEIMAKNVLATFAIANTIGISHSEIEKSINTFASPSGRCDIMIHNEITIIDDTYNSNLESAKAGIDILSEYKGNQKIAIIGDMLELGGLAQDHHYELGEYISNSKIDILLATGNFTQLTVNAARKVRAVFFHDKEDLIIELMKIVSSGDVVYVKGSRGMKMEAIIKKGLSK